MTMTAIIFTLTFYEELKILPYLALFFWICFSSLLTKELQISFVFARSV